MSGLRHREKGAREKCRDRIMNQRGGLSRRGCMRRQSEGSKGRRCGGGAPEGWESRGELSLVLDLADCKLGGWKKGGMCLALRCCCQGSIRIVAVQVGGFIKGVLDVVHEIQHCGINALDGTIVYLDKRARHLTLSQ